MRLRRAIAIGVFVGALLGSTAPARADITGFLGVSGGPSARDTKGVAVGVGFLLFGVEAEYGDTGASPSNGAPRIRTGMVNAVVQTPISVAGMQFYATAGGGIYHHDLESRSETNLGINVGGGVKKSLLGPLRVRADYRVFRFSGSPIGNGVVHRFYVGLNVSF